MDSLDNPLDPYQLTGGYNPLDTLAGLVLCAIVIVAVVRIAYAIYRKHRR